MATPHHIVKCLYCGERFDRDTEPTKKVNGNRYAHLECWEDHIANMTQEERDIEEFYKYTKELFGKDYNYIMTKKLAEKYVKENNYTYSGMLKTLKWYYEIGNNSIEKSRGSIGIIPYVYNDAAKYYLTLYKAQMVNKEKNFNNLSPKERKISITSPRVYVRPPHLWFSEDQS